MPRKHDLELHATGAIVGQLDIRLEHVKGRPPWWRRSLDWDLLKALKVMYWGIKVVYALGQLFGFWRERMRVMV